jgi:D-3-phosphoglycerate dehydrogenase
MTTLANRIVVLPALFTEAGDKPIQVLQAAGYEIVQNSLRRDLSEDEIVALLDGAIALIAGEEPISRRIIEQARDLKVISKFGVSVDSIDMDMARERGIVVTFTPGVHQISVAELTIALMLGLARNVPRMDLDIRRQKWTQPTGIEVMGKTLGIIGVGRCGKEVAKRAVAIGMNVQGFDHRPDEKFAEQHGIEYVLANQLLKESDFVTIHLNLGPDTVGFLTRERVHRMKPGAFLINASSLEFIDEDAVYEALKAKRIRGVAFDIHTPEPPLGHLFLELDNVIMTARAGSRTEETVQRQAQMSAENALAALQGKATHSVVA